MKICSKCGEAKDESEFSKKRSKCKDCEKEYQKEYQKEYRETNKDYQKEYQKANKDKLKEYYKEYRKANKDKLKKYYKNNKNRFNNPFDRFKQNLRVMVGQGFKLYSENGKTKACKEYGIDFEAIYKHIGPRPTGDYHLDHKIPLCKFDLDIPEHVRLAHLPQNLQWLPADENLSKNDSVDMELIGCSLVLLSIAKKIGLVITK